MSRVVVDKEMERGEVRTIEEELERVRFRAAEQREYMLCVNTHEINPLLKAREEGYQYLLRLPRVNERGCVEKYGSLYDKTENYNLFILMLGKRKGIKSFRQLSGPYWVFSKKSDAEKLKSALEEYQKNGLLEFETIDVNVYAKTSSPLMVT